MSIAATGITRWLPCIRAGAASPAPPGTWVILACQHSPVSTPVKAGATDKAWANPGMGVAVLAGHPPHRTQGPRVVTSGLIPTSRDQPAQRVLANRPI